MSAAAAGEAARPARDRLGAWCGWVMVGASALVPLLAWLSPLGYAPLLALMGLLCLPALRIEDPDRPVLMVLLGALVWTAASTTWSPYRPAHVEQSTILTLAFGLPLFWSAVCGARRADPRLNALALRILAWGVAALAAFLLLEALDGAAIYRRLHVAFYEPIRPDLARSNIAHASYVLALLWPAVLLGGLRRRWETALLALAVVSTGVTAHLLLSDAPVFAIPLAGAASLVVWRWPRSGPQLMAAGVAALGFAMPALIWAVRASGDYRQIEGDVQLSWSARMGYWSHALDWISDRPVRGWGLEASRAMGPGIQLHPHNGALQVWLELGLVGAVAAAAFWALSLTRLSRERPSLAMAGVAGAAATYVLFSWINFGLWQQWWLALGALIPVIAGMLTHRDPMPKST